MKNGKIVSSSATAERYYYVHRSLASFVKEKYNRNLSNMYFNDITEELVLDYVFYLQKRGIEQGHAGNVRNAFSMMLNTFR